MKTNKLYSARGSENSAVGVEGTTILDTPSQVVCATGRGNVTVDFRGEWPDFLRSFVKHGASTAWLSAFIGAEISAAERKITMRGAFAHEQWVNGRDAVRGWAYELAKTPDGRPEAILRLPENRDGVSFAVNGVPWDKFSRQPDNGLV